MEKVLREALLLMIAVILMISALTACYDLAKEKKSLERVRIKAWMDKLRDIASKYNLTFRW